MAKRPHPGWVTGYVTLLCGAAAGVVGFAAGDPGSLTDNLASWVGFICLLVLAERLVLFFHRSDARLGLSLAEAVLLTMYMALSWAEVVVGVAIAFSLVAVTHRKIGLVKSVFNIASPTVAAGVGGILPRFAEQSYPNDIVFGFGAAAIGTVVYAWVTHVTVAGAISLTEEKPFLKSALGVPRATVIMAGVGVLLGLHFAAAYVATEWALLVFPLTLVAISLGYRAVVQQDQERLRVQSLHEASRVLAASPDLGTSIVDFLGSVTRATSSLGATVVVDVEGEPAVTSVYAGEVTAQRAPLEAGGLKDLLAYLNRNPRSITDAHPMPAELGDFRSELAARSFLVVPLVERDEVVGLVMVMDRVGATDFGENDARLLEAMAMDLSLTLGSRRLFAEVVEQRERFQLLVESVNDYAIFLVDPQGVVASWNAGAERIQGYSADQIIGKHFSVFYAADEDPTLWMQELAAAATEGRHEVEGRRVRRDGSTFLANEVITPVRDPSGQLRGFAKVTRDITERVTAQKEKEALEAQLQQVQKLESIGQLAGGVAHDFNNILSVISNCSMFVLDELENVELKPDQRVIVEDVEEIRDAADRAAALTRQLLVFSRRDVIEPQILDVNDVIANLGKLMKRAVGDNIEIVTEFDPHIGTVMADPGQLEQVLLNLVINARDAMEGAGVLRITTRDVMIEERDEDRLMDVRSGRHVELRVTDTGSGMSPDVIEKAFDPFFTTKPKGQGTGLGLATVYGIVRRSGGRVAIESEVGRGTTFVIQLPFEEGDDLVGEIAAGPESDRASGETVLLVEDEDSVRAVTRRILSAAGYKVIEASNGTEALLLLQEWDTPITLLLTDIVMPGISGIELVERAGALRPGLKRVFMSAYSDAVSLSAAIDDGVPLIQKPFDRYELLTRLREVLDS